MTNSPRLTVFFDGLCPLCSREIDIYRKRDRAGAIHFVDITSSSFDAARENLDPVAVNRVFHVRSQSGEILTGVPAFAEIWRTIPGFGWLLALYRWGPTRFLLGLGYRFFVRVRPYLPRRERCDEKEGTCQR